MSKKTKLQEQLKNTWKTFAKQKKQIPITIISDSLFYYMLILLAGYVFTRMMQISEQLMQTIGQNLEQARQMPEMTAQYTQITQTIWMFFGAAILIWIIFKGINWYQAHKMLGRKIKTKQYILQFITTSAIFYLAVLMTIMTTGYINYKIVITGINTITPNTLAVIMIIIVWILMYFGSITYAKITEKNPIKKALKSGTKQWKKIFPAYIITTLVWGVSLALIYILVLRNIYITMIAIIAIILPAIHYTRLLMINTTKNR